MNKTLSFYRDLEVGILVRIHYHHGRCVKLIEKMERISENPPHVLEWQIIVWLCKVCREFLWNLLSDVWSSIPLWAMDDHPWLSIPLWDMDDHPNLDSCNILLGGGGSYSCLECFYWVSFLVKPSRCDLLMDNHHGWTKLGLGPHHQL